MVPEGWSEKPLAKLLNKVIDYRGKAPPKSRTGTRLITARNVRMGYVSFSHAEFIDENLYTEWMNRGLPTSGDIMFTTEAPLGNVAMFPDSGTYALGQRIVTLRPKQDVSPGFLFQYLLSDEGQSKVHEKASGSTALGIKSKELVKVTIPHPPLPEQRKIAEILSTWDRAIKTTEALLASARTQKRALMQSLLTGKRRFTEFEGQDWKEVRLGDVIICLDNKRVPLNSTQRNKMQGDIPYWGANGIVDYVDQFIFDEPLVLLAEDGGYFDEFATRPIACLSYGKAWVNNHAHVLRAGKKVQTEWLYFVLVHKNIMGFINSGTRSKLNKGDMLKIPLALPSLVEQSRISAAIGLADREVNDLVEEIEKLRTEKKALMQQLLTGKRRVVV